MEGPKVRLIDEWRKAHRMLSVQAMALAGAIQTAWMLLPGDMKAAVPPTVVGWVSVALLVGGIVGRLVDQPAVRE